MENRETFFNALLKTRYGKNIKKKLTKKAKKLPLSLKALALGSNLASGKAPIKVEKKVGKTGRVSLEANPKKKSFGVFFKKSF